MLVSSGGRRRVVPRARSQEEFAPPVRRNHLELNGAEGPILGRIRWIVTDGVLVADLFRDLLADRRHFVEVIREVGQTTGRLGDLLQNFFRVADHALFMLTVVLAENAD